MNTRTHTHIHTLTHTREREDFIVPGRQGPVAQHTVIVPVSCVFVFIYTRAKPALISRMHVCDLYFSIGNRARERRLGILPRGIIYEDHSQAETMPAETGNPTAPLAATSATRPAPQTWD